MKKYEAPCVYPWLTMDIGYSGFAKVGCCEYKGKPLAIDINNIDIPAIWRSEWFQELRGGFASDGSHPRGCRGCAKLVTPIPLKVLPEPGTVQQDNDDLCQADRRNYHTEPSGFPARYSFCFTPRCNLDCIMCSQHDSRECGESLDLKAEVLLRNSEVLSKASSILVSGGEPFVSKECIRFIEALCLDEQYSDVALEVVTNGILLDSILPTLEHKRRLSMHVSLDGMGETYEKIRKGGTWARVSRNIETFLETGSRLGRKSWKLTSSVVLMKSSLGGLGDLVKWCVERDIRLIFQGLMPTRETRDEDVLGNSRLLDQVPGWKESIEEAIMRLDSAGWAAEVSTLKNYYSRLISAPEGTANTDELDYKDFMAEPAKHGKRIAIWGTGTNYQYCWAKWLRIHVDELEFVGFVDNDVNKQGGELDGYPILSPDELQAQRPDTVIVATQIVWRNEIIKQIREAWSSNVQIV